MPSKMIMPTLTSERLIFRPHTREDLPACAALWGDPEVTRYIGGRPFTVEETWARLLRYVGHWQVLGFGYWVIVERASGRFAGEVGLADYQRELTPLTAPSAPPPFVGAPALGGPEAGWVIAPWASGRGLATEAVKTVLAWSDAHLEAPFTTCIIQPEHAASIRVAGKCGFLPQPPATYRGQPISVFQRARRS